MSLLLFFQPTATTALALGLPADFPLGEDPRPEFIYVGTEALNNESSAILEASAHKYRIVSAYKAASSQGRLRTLIGVADGVVHVQNLGAWFTFDGVLDPTLSPSAPYYWYAFLKGKAYIGDGLSEVVYDSVKGSISKLEAAGDGQVPEKCNLATVYRDRLVLAEGPRWYMSKVGDATDWDYFPATQTQTQAVAASTVGLFASDLIQTLIPGQNDYLIFGCSDSILLMRGDPAAGGQIDLVSDTTGMAFGNSWARDPNGVIYFFSNRGGVYRMAASEGGVSAPASISDATDGQDVTVQANFEAISLRDYRMELEWDYQRDGLRVMQIPYDETATTVTRSWFWSKKLNAWWPDRVGSSDMIVFSAWAADGDLPEQRRVIFGCRDGYVRELSDLAKNDDDVAMDAYVTIGPIQAGKGDDAEVAFGRLRAVLSAEKDGCTWEVYGSDTPDALNENATAKLIANGAFGPGMNPRLPVRARSAYLWLKLRNKAQNESFAVEEVSASVTARGSRRVRS